MRIGVDVGGTNTDAVVLNGDAVLAAVKSPTTGDIQSGVVAAIARVMADAAVRSGQIRSVMIGTTQFTNAFVEGKSLNRVATIRAGLPATESLRPMIDFPPHLRGAIGECSFLVRGGFEFDGREIAPLDGEAVRRAAETIVTQGIDSVAVSCVFAPIRDRMERQIAGILDTVRPGLPVTLSSEIGRVGLIERENAAIMNASLSTLSRRVIQAFHDALAALSLTCPFFISQNDGTLMTADFARKYPVLTFASGPTNSMRGAAFLSGVRDGIVVDIGGTTSDVGVLKDGFPRESALTVDIGSVRTNFRMPDVLAIGLGGGSRVTRDPLTVGPRSVALQLLDRARVFGGDTLTATDIAVAAGHAKIGEPAHVADLDKAFVAAATLAIQRKIEAAIDRVKTSRGLVPVVLVGGGAVLIRRNPGGASEVIRPERADVANAIGAALAQVGGEVDKVFSYDAIGREAALNEARSEALGRATRAGADPERTAIVSLDETPLGYLPAGAVRVRAKAIGDLAGTLAA